METAPQTIDILTREHRFILRGMDVAEAMARRFEADGALDGGHLEKMLDFIANYADAFHHKKEEDILFKWMGERGFPAQFGPIAVMLGEHDAGREIVANAREALKRWNGGDKSATGEAVSCLRAFASHLREHIYKEDNILYPMAIRLYGPQDDAELLRRYREKLPDVRSTAVQNEYENVLKALEEVYAK